MAITSGVTCTKLAAEEVRTSGFTHACTVPYSVLVTVGGATTAATVAILDVAVGDVVADCAYYLTTAFDASDAAIDSLTVIVGDDGDTDRFMPVTTPQLAVDGTEIIYFNSLAGGAPATSTMPFAYNTANTVDAVFTVAGGANPTMAELTSGSVTILLRAFSLNKLVTGLQ